MKIYYSCLRILVFLLLFSGSVFAQGPAKGGGVQELPPIPGEKDQSNRREAKRFLIGGFTASGFSWFGTGYQLDSRFAITAHWQEQRSIQRFDLDATGLQTDLSGVLTLTNSEKIQRQTSIQLEWFPFSGPYYFSAGLGLENYFEKQRRTEVLIPLVLYKDYEWNLSQQRGFLSLGAGFRYIFPSGFFIHLGGNLLGYPERSTHEQRGSYSSNTSWDYRQLQKDWQEPEKEARDRQGIYGAQIQFLIGIAI